MLLHQYSPARSYSLTCVSCPRHFVFSLVALMVEEINATRPWSAERQPASFVSLPSHAATLRGMYVPLLCYLLRLCYFLVFTIAIVFVSRPKMADSVTNTFTHYLCFSFHVAASDFHVKTLWPHRTQGGLGQSLSYSSNLSKTELKIYFAKHETLGQET